MRNLTILGATGSIGASTLKVVEQNPDLYSVVALAAGSNVEKMLALVEKWQPSYVAMACPDAASQLADDAARLRPWDWHLEVGCGCGDAESDGGRERDHGGRGRNTSTLFK